MAWSVRLSKRKCGLNVDGHDPKARARMGHTEEIARRCSGDLAAYDDPIARDQDFLDVEFHVRDRLGKSSDNLDRCLTTPALAGQIAPARVVLSSQDLLLQRLHVALNRLVEQLIPRSDGCPRLRLSECLR